MSQADFLRRFDRMAFGHFHRAGPADRGEYLPPDATPGATPVPVDVYVDKQLRDLDDSEQFVPVAGEFTVISFQLDQVQPKKGGVVTIGGLARKLQKEVERDESMSVWVVSNVR